MPQLAETIFRDFTTDGIPASGPHEPRKAEIREWGTNLETNIANAFTSGSSAIFPDKADLDANLAFASKTLAWVVTDPVAANNGIYIKNGTSGTGSWARVADLPYSFIKASDAGAGTPNAIQATSSIPIPSADGAALITLNIFEDNTASPVTVSFNGGTALTVKSSSGNDIAVGGLASGMVVAGYKVGTTFRLLSEQATAAIVAAAEDAANRAEAAALEAETLVASLSPGGTGAELIAAPTPLAARIAANVRGRVNFFDFLQTTRSAAVREQIMNGTFTGDLAVEWQAFRDALSDIDVAGGRPYGFIPECKIYSSVAPNFAMDYLTLDTQGHVRIEAIGAVRGFVIDGMGLGEGGYGVRSLNIGPLCASTVTGGQGVYVRRSHQSEFGGFQSLGSAFAGIQVDGCVSSNFHKPLVTPQAEPFLVNPPVGLYVSGTAYSGGGDVEPWHALIQTSWCKFDVPIMEYTPVGIQFDHTFGNTIIGGTAEGCSNIGMIMGADAVYNKLIGIDFEQNTTRDLEVQGRFNEFYGVDSQTIALFYLATCYGNKVFGGHWSQMTFNTGASRNVVTGSNVDSITDTSSGPARNRFRDIADNAGNWTDRWLTWAPAVTAGVGTLTSASASGEYKVRDGDTVDFNIEIIITTNGTGAANINVTVPFNAAINSVFSGKEIAATAKGITGAVAAGTNVLSMAFSDGTYPGGDGRRIIVSGTYRRA